MISANTIARKPDINQKIVRNIQDSLRFKA